MSCQECSQFNLQERKTTQFWLPLLHDEQLSWQSRRSKLRASLVNEYRRPYGIGIPPERSGSGSIQRCDSSWNLVRETVLDARAVGRRAGSLSAGVMARSFKCSSVCMSISHKIEHISKVRGRAACCCIGESHCLRRRGRVLGQLVVAVHWPWPTSLQVLVRPRLQRDEGNDATTQNETADTAALCLKSV